ncbi:HSP20 family protein [Deinococcus reticulitermitis]|uniref:HSP20 family protein n=1 Tax=Deinococcus reticulitermitis TaxID=856736 RepID=A0A1H6V9D5_9DEIO|nr:Hsp20/alpha crystallin family protein [Deinococcus reticulitermitis]SEJ00436.1 HSP20 family protein [Deinococcus reticulitermitis]
MEEGHNEPVLARLHHLMALREQVETLGQTGPWVPAADWRDADTHLELLLDVPGVDPESLALHEDGQQVTVSGERPGPAQLLRAERPSGPFSRTFTFPEAVCPNSGQAHLGGGVLTVRFEKKCPTIDVESEEAAP